MECFNCDCNPCKSCCRSCSKSCKSCSNDCKRKRQENKRLKELERQNRINELEKSNSLNYKVSEEDYKSPNYSYNPSVTIIPIETQLPSNNDSNVTPSAPPMSQ